MTTSPIKRLLIVDDEVNVALTLSEGLQALGDEYQVDVASNGQAALELISEGEYDLILTDYKMAGMSGLSLALAVNKVHPHTQIIMMTAYGSASLRNSARLIPVSGFIEKPCSLTEIRDMVLRVLATRSGNADLAFVIEDNEVVAGMYSKALGLEGYHVEIIRNGALAQKRLADERPRLILLDLHLPEVDGTILLQQIHRMKHLNDSIILVTTGDSLLGQSTREKADLVLEKPVTLTQLRELGRRFRKNNATP